MTDAQKLIEEAHWLIYSREHNAWWRPKSAGYTTDSQQAGRYRYVDAKKRCTARDPQRDGSPSEVMIPAPESFIDLARRAERAEAALAERTEERDMLWDAVRDASKHIDEIKVLLRLTTSSKGLHHD